MKIQEIIVVEGKDDTRRLREVVDADTIETIGSAINEDILMQIEHAQETRGVIVLPTLIFQEKNKKNHYGSCSPSKTCFLPRTQAKPKKKGSLGVEHASDAAILEALKRL